MLQRAIAGTWTEVYLNAAQQIITQQKHSQGYSR